jgi:hypothetical protein
MPAPWERFSAAPTQDSGPWSRFSQSSGHEPGLADDVKASASFLGNELLGVGSAVNPVNIAKGVYNTVAHPIDTAVGLAHLPGQMYDQFQNGDMEGLAKSIGQLAGNVAMAKAIPEAPGAAKSAVATGARVADAAGTVVDAAKTIAADPTVLKTVARAAVGYRAGKVWDLAVAAHKALKQDAEADAASTAPVKASTDVSSKVEISPNVSVDSASNALGTKPTVDNVASSGKGYRTADTLDAPTQTALAKAAQSGKLNSLPADQKTTLVNAVKAGDNETVNKIVAQTAQGSVVDTNVANKVAILVKFAKDHNIDLEAISPEQRQTVADGAVAYAKMNGHGVLPKSGAYRGISDSTLQYVKDALAKMK